MFQLISGTFGPATTKIILHKQTGEVTITSDGSSILEKMNRFDPIIRLLIEGCLRHHRDCGDQSKSFFLMAYVALSSCSDVSCRRSTGYFHDASQRQVLIRSLHWVVQNVLKNEDFHSYLVKNYAFTISPTDLRKAALLVVKTFMTGKFSVNAVNYLADATLNFIGQNQFSSPSDLTAAIDKIEKDFDSFVHKIPGALLRDSKTVKGILVKQQLSSFVSHTEMSHHRLLVATFDDALLPSSDVCIEFSNIFVSATKILMEWIEKCRKRLVSIICYQGKALESFRSLCEENEIALVDCLLSEDVDFICRSLNILPHCDVTEELNCHVAEVKVSEIEISNQNFTNFVPLTSHNLTTLLLCSPSPGLCSQYKSSVFNALRVTKHWLKGCDHHPDNNFQTALIRGGGSFFAAMGKIFSDIKAVQQILPDVAWTNQSTADFHFARSVLSEVFLVIPRTLFQNCFRAKDKNFRFAEYLHDLNQLATTRIFDSTSFSLPVQPLSCQLTLLYKVISTTIQVLRIDSIISIDNTVNKIKR